PSVLLLLFLYLKFHHLHPCPIFSPYSILSLSLTRNRQEGPSRASARNTGYTAPSLHTAIHSPKSATRSKDPQLIIYHFSIYECSFKSSTKSSTWPLTVCSSFQNTDHRLRDHCFLHRT
ncbi:hypothetical protein V8E53_002966, partial [Lactarius tabidus]